MKSIKEFFPRKEAAVPINTGAQASDATSSKIVDEKKVTQHSNSERDPKFFQPSENFKFPPRVINGRKRSCQASWFKKFPWLHYEKSNDSVLCIICIKHRDKSIAQRNKEDTYVTTGYKNWKKAPTIFMEHQLSKTHTAAMAYEYVVPKCGDIVELMVSEQQDKRLLERKYLLKIMECIRYLARQGLALRGHEEGDGNLTQLLKLMCKDNADILRRIDGEMKLESGQRKYLHNDMQNEILQLMARKVLLKKLESVQSSQFFALIADESGDVSNKELLSICFRWVEGLDVCEDFFGFYQIPNIKSDTIFMAIKDCLVRMRLSLKDLRGQAYDGASNMLGKKSGVAVRIAAEQPKALATHCLGHSLNLGIKRTMTSSKMMRDVMGTVTEIISLVKYSPKRENMLGDIKNLILFESQFTDNPIDAVAPNLNTLCLTRWTVRGTSYLKIIENFDALMKLWDISLTGSLDTDIKARMIGVQNQMTEFQFLYGLHLSQRLFSISDNLSRALQSQAMSALSGLHMAELTIKTFKEMRTDNNAELFFKTVEKKHLTMISLARLNFHVKGRNLTTNLL